MEQKKENRIVPKTSRGEKRVLLILDAAAQVIAEVGYEAATTNAIAKRAGTSIGSLYQFFPNKEALVAELAKRYRAQLRAILDKATNQAAKQVSVSWQLEQMIDRIVEFNIQNIAFQPLFCTVNSSLEAVIALKELEEEMFERVSNVFALWAPHVSTEKMNLYAKVCIHTVQALLPLTNEEQKINSLMVHELKRMIYGYLLPIVKNEI